MVSVEDSMSMVHCLQGPPVAGQPCCAASRTSSPPWRGPFPVQPHRRTATLMPRFLSRRRGRRPGISQDYARLRDLIEACQTACSRAFHRFNERLAQPKGFWLPNPAARREWKTASGKAHFHVQVISTGTAWHQARCVRGKRAAGLCSLMSLRSPTSTTPRSMADDRYRGVSGRRLFIHPQDAQARAFAIGDRVDVGLLYGDGQRRQVHDFLLVAWRSRAAAWPGYFPSSPLVAAEARAQGANTPAGKAVPSSCWPAQGHDRA